MASFSANLGFLWQELPLPDAIRAAKAAGFDAVECHWPYNFDAGAVAAALRETGLTMLGLNTSRGNVEAGDNGLAAIPGRENEAQAAIRQAVDYAVAIGALNIHVMAGKAEGEAAHRTFVANLAYACEQAAAHDITILIEPLNHRDAPGYFLKTSGQAIVIINQVAASNLKLMFDCYHLQIMEGDISKRLEALQPHIGHVQIAAVPDRAEPDHGELDYRHIVRLLDTLGYEKPVGAEYRPKTTTDAGLSWLSELKAL
ncbi:hydroxypyruvate isomerase family protein [Brucella haematophila]|uniref:TIM barrel protein n=1 Tax=Brucella haematophila TaxID=419474 RepID=A0ABX1DMN9_9HYPH|nr:TIM barrel protein [Brucella haematophila]NKC04227.1 TIM barrel protein [Brucella haematophila]TMV06074.1 TIM barrel protein [Brucella haematophila]